MNTILLNGRQYVFSDDVSGFYDITDICPRRADYHNSSFVTDVNLEKQLFALID